MGTRSNEALRLDERDAVELPLLEQLRGLGWTIIDLKDPASPALPARAGSAAVVLEPILRERLLALNDWLEPDQLEHVVKILTKPAVGKGLLAANRAMFDLIVEGVTVDRNRRTGETSPKVRVIDFDDPSPGGRNDFTAVCQLRVRVLGSDRDIIPDIVLFVNGLPLVVIECKSPKQNDWQAEAIDQLLRYSEQRGADGNPSPGEGSFELFRYSAFTVITCRTQAQFGTITTRSAKHFYAWSDPWPLTVQELDHGASGPSAQQRLVAGMLCLRNLLDLVRDFTLFSTDERGRGIKIVARYQQFRAVKKAVARLLAGQSPRARSGIIWHTQGSGKSLTMMFMVRVMYRIPQLQTWKIVFVTDRTQLEEQLGANALGVGFEIKPATSIDKLKELLRSDSSDLVLAMIQKFQEAELHTHFPQLNAGANILVMTDEAHRSQYKDLGANLDRALPNATRIGYTGTPIDKTEQLFGDYIDQYTMGESIDDGVTLEIIYEGRSANAEVTDQVGADAKFEDVFSDYNLGERLQILGYASRDAYLDAEPVIAEKARDMVAHYLAQVFPNGFKAQVVANSREAAVAYRTYICLALADAIERLERSNPNGLDLDRLRQLRPAVVISGSNNDAVELRSYTRESTHKADIASFKRPFGDAAPSGAGAQGKQAGVADGNVGIIIVNEMLLTGFDAPIEQVLYLDRVIRAHNLLQAIARVNRVGPPAKTVGFVVDYVGIARHLKRALDDFAEREQKEVTKGLKPPADLLRALAVAHKAVLDLLAQWDVTDLNDVDALYDLFHDEDVRFAYIAAFRVLTAALNDAYPMKEALDYAESYKQLVAINVLAARHLHDARMSMKGIPAKLRQITNEFLEAKGIDPTVAPISIMDARFDDEVGKRKRSKTKAAAVEHAIRHHIDVNIDDDPELYASFSEAVQQILRDFANNWDRIYEELERLRARIRQAQQEPTYGLDRRRQMPIFRLLRSTLLGQAEPDEDQIGLLVDLTQQLYNTVERELQLIGFWESIPAGKRLRAELQAILLSARFVCLPGMIEHYDAIISRVMEIAKRQHDAIVAAAAQRAEAPAGLAPEVVQALVDAGYLTIEQDAVAVSGALNVGFMTTVCGTGDLSSAKVSTLTLNLDRILAGHQSAGALALVPLTGFAGLRGALTEASPLWFGVLALAVLVQLGRDLAAALTEELGPRYAAVLVALRDRTCPDGLSDELLRKNVDYLLQEDQLPPIPEDKFEQLLATLANDVKCIDRNEQGQWCLRSKVRFRP
jgi:type I restriction enzyme, R subunit